MNKNKLNKIAIVALLFFVGVVISSNKPLDDSKVTNVILLIGDGMGTTHVYAAMSVADRKLNIERSQYFGYTKTYSSNNYTTDSGAGATAFSTGKKAKNYSVGLDSTGKPMKTIVEYANKQGIATGLVASCNLAHATPAAFVAHQPSRQMYANIAKDFLKTKVDVLIGGGKELFDTTGVIKQMKRDGYQVAKRLESISIESDSPVVCFVAKDHPQSVLNGRGEMLPKATEIALKKLKHSEKGFFLMVESSQIDWGGHANDINYITSEVIDFDKAVGKAYDFADKNPGTLVIVTADHETGGLTLPSGSINNKSIEAIFSTSNHTGVMVPLFAYGAGAENFSAILDNTEIFDKIMEALGLEND